MGLDYSTERRGVNIERKKILEKPEIRINLSSAWHSAYVNSLEAFIQSFYATGRINQITYSATYSTYVKYSLIYFSLRNKILTYQVLYQKLHL